MTLVGDSGTAWKLGGRTIAAGKGSRASGGLPKVRARLKPAAKRRLGRLRRGRATLEVTVVDGGKTQRFAKAVTLRRQGRTRDTDPHRVNRLRPFRQAFLLYGIAIGCAAAAGYINGITEVAIVLTVVAMALVAAYVLLA